MKIILLVAGMGTRLKDRTKVIPKAIVDVHGKSLICYQLEMALRNGFEEIIVIGGFFHEKLEAEVKTHCPQARLLYNPLYKISNIHTLYAAREFLNGPFIVCNVDHIYPYVVLDMLRRSPGDVVGLCDFDRPLGPDDMKVLLSSDGGIEEISKKLPLFDGGYCGMTKVDTQGLAAYLAILDRLAAPRADGPVVENILGELAREKRYPRICDISGLRWLEVDDEGDYQNAERILRMVPRFLEQRKG